MAEASGWSTLLVRYGEIGIKSPAVRARWEKRLADNVEGALVRRGVEGQVVREWGRMFLHTNDSAKALDALAHTFGVVSASVIEEIPADLDAIERHVVERSRDVMEDGKSFAVRARRTGEHAFSSMDLQKRVGSAVWRANEDRTPRVDLVDPDVEFHVEVRFDKAYFYRDVVPGPGGLPLGTQGRVAVVLDSPRAALAAWLMMKRGCTPIPLAPDDVADSTPFREAVTALAAWAPLVRVARMPLPDAWKGDPLRRRAFLLRAAGALARPRKGQAVVVSDGLAGAAALAPLDGLAGLPVFRPLGGFLGDSLGTLARQAELPHVGPEPASSEAAPMEVPPEEVRDALRAQSTWEVRA